MHTGIKDRYKDSYILNEVMKQILDLQSTGLLVTDAEYQINYYNVEMERIIRKSMKKQFFHDELFFSENTVCDPVLFLQ